MKNLHAAVIAALFGLSAVSGIFMHPQVAAADPGDRGEGRGRGHNKNANWQNGRWSNCNPAGHVRGRSNHSENENENENDNDNDEDQGNRAAGYPGPYNGPVYGGQYGQNGQYGQYGRHGRNGQYGQYGQYCNGTNGGYGQQGNTTIQGVITAVNGNQVTLATGIGQSITINDQPALDNQTSGRVTVGRYVTVYGYWQNGVFYATQMN